ncbi:MAG: TerC family protein [Hyphomicrobiales bacterium]|nr:TerC family protein [Hyphomicrobiales bacterium]
MWLTFFVIVIALLVFDLGVLHRKEHEIGVKESLKLSAFYIIFGLSYGAWVWFYIGEESGINYVTGFVLEKSLAMDNIFVIATIFSYFAVPRKYQHRVLFWGILGVILLRGIMIGAGAALVTRFDWVLYIFAAFLVFTGIRMLFMDEEERPLAENPLIRFLRRHFRVTDEYHGSRFVVRLPHSKTGKSVLYMTPLLTALILIEIADVIFAVDSVPAIFAITTDPFIVYTSNVFAILGLRALFFALSAMQERFIYLKYALATVLIFIGAKVFVADMLDVAKIPPLLSLLVTVVILATGIVLSLWKTRERPESQAAK